MNKTQKRKMEQFNHFLVKRVAKAIGCPDVTMRRIVKNIVQGQTVYIKTSKGAFNVRTTSNGNGIETLKVG